MLFVMARALVIAIAFLVGGCRDKDLEQLKTIRDEVCACRAASCGEAAMKKVPQHDVKSNHRAQALANEMLACMAKLYLRDRPTTDPDAEPAAGSAEPAAPPP